MATRCSICQRCPVIAINRIDGELRSICDRCIRYACMTPEEREAEAKRPLTEEERKQILLAVRRRARAARRE